MVHARDFKKIAQIVTAIAIAGVVAFATLARLTHQPQERFRAFYYWKTRWNSSTELEARLRTGGVNRLYFRFFDVSWDDAQKRAFPVAPLRFDGVPPQGIEIVPVVFLSNRIFLSQARDSADRESLPSNVWAKVNEMAKAKGIAFKELQLDCDWSDRSRENYFFFINRVKALAASQGVILSATIRLHQVKYSSRTGVPPVDRGMLMFYNMGQLSAESERLSIYNSVDAQKYTSWISRYSLPLDLVLPAFSWMVHSREGSIVELIEDFSTQDLDQNAGFVKTGDGNYQAQQSFFFRGRYFRKNDLLRAEEITPVLTRQAAELVARSASKKGSFGTIAFFDLDERTSHFYENSEFQKIFQLFN